jgi:hypothetical protein
MPDRVGEIVFSTSDLEEAGIDRHPVKLENSTA